ncbi:hypothetical protein [Sphingobacterium gobiense]|uniref:Uncharacterized protein n=1 Tax=Sphingobacterium gobiense TaxID=1382456 RepID=A0A2S9JM46_9SPHI|nr:hypothetical protein [Sphingobacterium gobiense]PRD54069.1 hypothetical protein C5749_11275 [Sphingobacterium gobiense]
MKSKQEIQLEAVNAILSGELLLEEAMAKYNVKDKRTMLAWIKKMIPLLRSLTSQTDSSTETLRGTASRRHHNNLDTHILQENTLLRKVISLQDKVSELEKTNMQLIRHRNLLLEKISLLESCFQINQKESP